LKILGTHATQKQNKTGQAAKNGKKWQWADQMEAFCPFFHLQKHRQKSLKFQKLI